MKKRKVDCLTQNDYRALKNELKEAHISYKASFYQGLSEPLIAVEWTYTKGDKDIYNIAIERMWATRRAH